MPKSYSLPSLVYVMSSRHMRTRFKERNHVRQLIASSLIMCHFFSKDFVVKTEGCFLLCDLFFISMFVDVFLKNFVGKKWVKYHGPILLQNKLLVLATDKFAYWFSPEDGSLLSREKIGNKISSPPIVVNKKLIFVSEEGMLNILD